MRRAAGRRWYLWLTLFSIGGLVAPVVWILVSKRHAIPTGDAFIYHWQASLIADGSGWFINPYSYLLHHQVVQSASHPPFWTLVLAFADVIGLQSYLAQLLGACLIGAAAVFVTGLAAREAAGPRAGLIAAALAALYPNYWINYGLGLSETLVLLLVAAVILVSLQFWRRPSARLAALLGLLCALTALARSEQALLIIVVLVPLALALRGVAVRRRLAYAGVGVLVALVTLGPWVGFNLSRFSHPTYLSTDLGTTLATANCKSAYYGLFLGSDDFRCLDTITLAPGDESADDSQYRRVAVTYAKAHLTRLPVVLAARLGREFGFYKPIATLRRENHVNDRPITLSVIGLVAYYLLIIGAVCGAIKLRRRRVTIVPFVGILAELMIASMLTFGQTRYRVPGEVALVILTSVSIDSLVSRRSATATPSGGVDEGLAAHPGGTPSSAIVEVAKTSGDVTGG